MSEKSKRPHKQILKSLPSIEFMGLLQDVCSGHQQNYYDKKNHRLVLGNTLYFFQSLKNKYNRSQKSFVKQLNMLGFKSKKMHNYVDSNQIQQKNEQVQSSPNNFSFQNSFKQIKPSYNTNLVKEQRYQAKQQNQDIKQTAPSNAGFQPHQKNNHNTHPTIPIISFTSNNNNNTNNNHNQSPLKTMPVNNNKMPTSIVYSWRGKKEPLLSYQLGHLENSLKNKLQKTNLISKQLQMKRQKMDRILQNMLFKIMIKPDQIDEQYREKTIKQMKNMVNTIQKQCGQIVGQQSEILANELQIYRLLVFRQNNQADEQKQKNNK